MEAATLPQPKRTRFDSSVRSPDDSPTTPMAAAKETLRNHCASLQPEIATLLSNLGKEHLLLLQKIALKTSQLQKLVDDDTLIPRSARIKFALTTSKLAEANEGYIRLKEETEQIVITFQSDLKKKIISLAELEVKLLQAQIREDLAKTLLVATKALLICDVLPTDPHQIVNTILEEYHEPLLAPFDISTADFRTLYRQTHELTVLPTPIPVVLQDRNNREEPIPTPVYRSFVKIYKVIDNILLAPWSRYQATKKSLQISIALKNLRVAHLEPAATEAAAMLIDNEQAADPPQLRSIVDAQVAKKTASLEKQVSSLRSQVQNLQNKKPAAKNVTRGQKGASLKKKSPSQVDAVASATQIGTGNRQKKAASTKPSKQQSNKKKTNKSTPKNRAS